jgi:hypothetical protein
MRLHCSSITFVGARNSFMLQQIVHGLEKKFKEHPQRSEHQDDVMRKTGPLIFTKIILKEIRYVVVEELSRFISFRLLLNLVYCLFLICILIENRFPFFHCIISNSLLVNTAHRMAWMRMASHTRCCTTPHTKASATTAR